MKHCIKRAGHKEAFDERKLYASIYAACLSVRTVPHEAELIADRVSGNVQAWLNDKDELTSHHLFEQTAKEFKKYHPDAAYMYVHLRDIS